MSTTTTLQQVDELALYLDHSHVEPCRILTLCRLYDEPVPFDVFMFLLRAENHIQEQRRKLTKRYRHYSAPYGTTTGFYDERWLMYKGQLTTIKRFIKDDGPMYVSGHCPYNGDRHKTLRDAIKCAKDRQDNGLTWNSSDKSARYDDKEVTR